MGDNQTASSDPNRQLSTLSWWQSGPAELAEWERIEQLLAAAPAGAVYDPDTDPVVRAEFEADAAAAAAREAELRELGTLEQAEPRAGDEAVRDELTR
ncbi:hypothetical protein GCM10010331_69400 [Streptomyces xanthochromogenes]|uniref:hypothetical protein n=1 Tax=Streptomyces xanthochromogenes TaxID=67384 RepID=UPI0019A3A3B2|nr:hypothetical protein [Streptomyces xanthochromogenes]GHB71594.1 hypothetical protein GCM10010331_69400 [Streptomyces xanthochromogenes]